MCGSSKRESIFADIHTPIVTGPFLDATKPGPVTVTEILGRKPVRRTVCSDQYVHGLFKGSGLCLVHDRLRRDPKQILEHQPIGARLKLCLWQAGHIVAIIGSHKNLMEEL